MYEFDKETLQRIDAIIKMTSAPGWEPTTKLPRYYTDPEFKRAVNYATALETYLRNIGC